ncbi:alcohol dehydrogenase catalytic domain-containing protein [Streptomyces roseirectus]|uniref:Alcohol dehydrogenase catalytic domain-containing protein n=1 Tax=Streptomyces roseirectus TaxID=2768066 RepID=A0A7H0IQW1_9ACTN|nr:alcohol dehydrogenase catalytic domain-containing protein [Streptomyces roseirectus]QNP75177.1 alcohol dehydrogenase catalytic domain-containing protein [Streptomyces roseirectus]
MRALTWHGKRDVRVEEVPDPKVERPDDVIVEVTSSGICGSDLHLYEVFGPYLEPGDILGHEAVGVVAETGPEVTGVAVGDRVVVPFNVSCNHCWMCRQGLQSQCETTQVTETGSGAALFGYTKLYGQVPGGQAELLRVPFGNTLPIKVEHGPPDDRYVYLSDVLPTAWQAVEYADIPPGGSVTVLGLGPIGDMATRVARLRGADLVVGVDRVDARLERARRLGTTVVDLRETGTDAGDAVRDLTGGRGTDAVIDAVGLEAHGAPVAQAAQWAVGLLPGKLARPLMERAGVDRTAALYGAVDAVRRGGTLSLSGVYGGAATPMPMLTMFDKQLTIRMDQANVWRWVDAIRPHLTDDDPLGVDTFATHHLPLTEAPSAYAAFQTKTDGMIKTLLRP